VRVCATSATFGNAAIALGLSGAEMGMSYFLPRIVGTSIAAEWMLTGRTVDAAEALRSGLVSEVVADEELIERAVALAGTIAGSILSQWTTALAVSRAPLLPGGRGGTARGACAC